MQQRRPRLGDIVDDYCPRERRITNHAVVAMIEDEVKQTRCSTCDAEHEYKQAKLPAQRRRKDASATGELVTGTPRKRSASAAEPSDMPETPPVTEPPPDVPATTHDSPEIFAAPADTEPADTEPADAEPAEAELSTADTAPETDALDEPTDDDEPRSEDEGPVHRRLIRATLPRPEGQAPERKLPEFTMHQREVNGNRAGRPQRRGPRPGQMRGTQHGSGQATSSRFGSQRQGPGSRHGGSGHVPRHGSGQGGGQQGQQGNRSGGAGQQGQPGQPRQRHRKRGR